MSFSKSIKQEIANYEINNRHCVIAELTAYLTFTSQVGEDAILIQSDNLLLVERVEKLLQYLFRMQESMTAVDNGKKKKSYEIRIVKQKELVLSYCKTGVHLEEILKKSCCKRAFLRAAFLTTGAMSDPEKTYHLEFAPRSEELASLFMAIMQEFQIYAKMIRRKGLPVVYLKEGEQISLILNVLSAHLALMELENLRIVKEMRNSVNRVFNCEMANLSKTVKAAAEQNQAIDYIENTVGLEYLPQELLELALLRRESEEYSLQDLGKMLSTPIGRSGVNHRLKKIIQIAEEIRERREEIAHDNESNSIEY